MPAAIIRGALLRLPSGHYVKVIRAGAEEAHCVYLRDASRPAEECATGPLDMRVSVLSQIAEPADAAHG